jgi:hypothetical protein
MIHAGTIRIRSGVDGPRLRRMLDELDQPIAEHGLSGRDGDLLADFEALGADGMAAAEYALEILEPVPETTHEVLTRFSSCLLEQLGVGVQEIRRRCGCEYLSADEAHEACVSLGHPRSCAQRLLPRQTPNSRMRARKC